MTMNEALGRNIRSGQTVIGSWMEIPHPMVAATMAQTGVDFLLFDGEHGPNPPHRLLDVLPNTERHGTPLLYRVAWNRPEYIKAALDMGAAGVMVPMVNSREEAVAAVAAAKYPPHGTRGIGAWRASNYYQEAEAYRATANDRSLVVLQIETVEALNAIDAIAATPGVDVVYIGPADLAMSFGSVPGVVDGRLLDACKAVTAAARRNGIAAGIDLSSLDHVEEFVRLGLTLFTHGLDYHYLLSKGRETVEALRGKTGA